MLSWLLYEFSFFYSFRTCYISFLLVHFKVILNMYCVFGIQLDIRVCFRVIFLFWVL